MVSLEGLDWNETKSEHLNTSLTLSILEFGIHVAMMATPSDAVVNWFVLLDVWPTEPLFNDKAAGEIRRCEAEQTCICVGFRLKNLHLPQRTPAFTSLAHSPDSHANIWYHADCNLTRSVHPRKRILCACWRSYVVQPEAGEDRHPIETLSPSLPTDNRRRLQWTTSA